MVYKAHLTPCLGLLLLGAAQGACSPPPSVLKPTPPAAPQEDLHILNLPPRSPDAPGGRAFIASLRDADEIAVHRAIFRELSQGNIPDLLRPLSRIEFRAQSRSGKLKTVVIWATWDYLRLGSDSDSIRIPIDPITAQQVANQAGACIPTSKLVDIIYEHASVVLAPKPLAPSAWMVRPEEFLKHHELIEQQLLDHRKEIQNWPPQLLAGHKKDIVISNKLSEKNHRLAIYGWHTSAGNPIQPVSTYHGDWYSDYSHGARLIGNKMLIDGTSHRIEDVLKDEELAPLISHEGVISQSQYITSDGPGRTQWWPKLEENNEKKR